VTGAENDTLAGAFDRALADCVVLITKIVSNRTNDRHLTLR
jgi:hypothetical protein